MGLLEKIKEIEVEIGRTQKNKGTDKVQVRFKCSVDPINVENQTLPIL